ncbi:MG2 domain-containing protein [Thermoflavifilum thermophilum]|uniref:MG2 domain-containing protein n=1 Tax=Thermoflavifilum thermophilum TaxID=1393122 RepID=A0A1I7N1B7_9BACT|nr:MG2 domain-containing protein [Thermoflavifilum thermophilum]SFV28462.1 MG2 domain-containing protein [Thermoflavifilum thermophilum]
MKNRLVFGLWVILLLGALSFVAEDPLGERILQALHQFHQQYPQEKVYVQLDKDYYAAGETIWFKAYVTLNRTPTPLSTNLYVELINARGEIVKRDILPIEHGGAAGDFELSDQTPPGAYRIRAYTAWMLNFDHAFLFHKDIRIFPALARGQSIPDSLVQQAASVHATTQLHYSVKFLPEGGDLVVGVPSVVAFAAVDENGLPINVDGKVMDDQGHQVATLHSLHDGMGSFTLTPQPGRLYRAVFTQSNGAVQSFDLPRARPEGIVLHVLNSYTVPSRIFFNVMRSEQHKERYNHLKIVAQMEEVPVFMADINFDEGLSGGMIPTDRLPSGVLHITVFDTTATPLAERLVFVSQPDELHLKLTTDELHNNPRSLNLWQLSAPDAVNGHFSISITDADALLSFPDENNILSYTLLNSDIKGYIYHPGWYFRNTDTATLKALDLVMLTHGWRRFAWEKILQNQFPAIRYPAENANLVIKGQAYAMNGGSVNMIIRVPADTQTFFVSAPVNNLGEFMVTGLKFHDTAQVFFQGQTGKDQYSSANIHLSGSFTDNLAQIPLESPLYPPVIRDKQQLIQFLTAANERNRINRMMISRSILLQSVTITGEKKTAAQKLDEEYTSGMFRGGDAVSFDLTQEHAAYLNIFQYLQGRVAGLSITGDLNDPVITWRGGRPALYLDEMPVDAQTLSSINVNDIALVKVFRPPFMGGFNGANGAIAVYTKKGGGSSTTGGLARDKKVGYTLVKQFYSPDYGVTNPNNDLPDQRITLYWNPDLQSDSLGGPAKIRFYNNDFTRRYHVVIEGMDDRGRIGRLDTVLSVGP